MDWNFTEEQEELAALVRQILEREVTEERRRANDATDARFDRKLYDTLRQAGVFDPDIGFIGGCRVFTELGRVVAPVSVQCLLVSGMLRDERIVSPAVGDEPARVDNGLLTGRHSTVPGATYADAFVVSADDGLYLVGADAPGVSIERQLVTSTEIEGRVTFDRAPGTRIGLDRDVLVRHLTVATCAHQLGVCERALELTAEYSKQRVQFDRPIATFQAVGQRLADAYIDVQAIRLTLWQAAWRLAEGLPCDEEIATAKFWASDAGHRVAHTAVHVHGGMGIDLDYHLHRYFTAAKRNEFAFGGATKPLVALGERLASEPA
jgi:alkylation response protein AidB-like acyl-CoA dehydrogenase